MPSSKLGGFKVLRDVSVFSVAVPRDGDSYPPQVLDVISDQQINLPYVSCLATDSCWQILFAVPSGEQDRVGQIIRESVPGEGLVSIASCVVLSLFPHRSDPGIAGTTIWVLERENLRFHAMANSPSAISLLLQEECLAGVSNAFVHAFDFPPECAPVDWNLAQKGKEQIYKEVVASYQEKQPKVYGLEIREGLDLYLLEVKKQGLGLLAKSFRQLGDEGIGLSYISSLPLPGMRNHSMALCLPATVRDRATSLLSDPMAEIGLKIAENICLFTMNGPHFGDRYGLAWILMRAFQEHHLDLLALNCTVASMTGIVWYNQTDLAIKAIRTRFHVPEVTRRVIL
ncbi:MAG: hypothetical protein JRH06_13045 [Deltaproteobacteria bacterium]|nr:hypothetical protein [Deltaproteobacteria bacterium]MBW2138468.1 hypothetical protein [Deltaproteobacteria bacterium]